MSRYLILIHGDDTGFAELPADAIQQMINSLKPFEEKVAEEGKLLSTHRLVPATDATLVRIKNAERSITDGPFAETKEQLGGYYLVEAQDEAQVLRWLELIPNLMDSTLEIRQVVEEERSLP
jgi:hypothetical protein